MRVRAAAAELSNFYRWNFIRFVFVKNSVERWQSKTKSKNLTVDVCLSKHLFVLNLITVFPEIVTGMIYDVLGCFALTRILVSEIVTIITSFAVNKQIKTTLLQLLFSSLGCVKKRKFWDELWLVFDELRLTLHTFSLSLIMFFGLNEIDQSFWDWT